MHNHKNKQKESQLHKLLSMIITNEVNAPKAKNALVTEVSLTNDGSILTVYVTFINNQKESLKELQNASSFIRNKLASNSTTRRVPSLIFKIDTKLDEVNDLNKLLEEIK